VNSYLQDVVIIKSGCDGDLLCDNQGILEILIWDIVELLAMPYRQKNVCMMSRVMTRTNDPLNPHLGITRE